MRIQKKKKRWKPFLGSALCVVLLGLGVAFAVEMAATYLKDIDKRLVVASLPCLWLLAALGMLIHRWWMRSSLWLSPEQELLARRLLQTAKHYVLLFEGRRYDGRRGSPNPIEARFRPQPRLWRICVRMKAEKKTYGLGSRVLALFVARGFPNMSDQALDTRKRMDGIDRQFAPSIARTTPRQTGGWVEFHIYHVLGKGERR